MEEAKVMPGMETRVRLCRVPVEHGRTQLLGFAELVIGGAFVIRDIRILKMEKEGRESVFVSFPSRRRSGEEHKYYDVAHPITSQAYRQAVDTIIQAFHAVAAKA
jgi:DNA-binding cell septation regulator SpoVG